MSPFIHHSGEWTHPRLGPWWVNVYSLPVGRYVYGAHWPSRETAECASGRRLYTIRVTWKGWP
jgi:hypothetical protein